GYLVVSGLARGVDGAAHEGAMASGTIAVLGGGIDDIYPPEHADLYARIAKEGCLVSENAVGRRAQARDFPRRNRIISGLSLGVVVVEAETRSGSLITARLAAEQGREVFAVPGSPLDPRAKGPNALIRQGANLCEDAEDVVRVLQESGSRLLGEPQSDLFDASPSPPDEQDAAADRLRETAYALLSPTPVALDEMVRALKAPTSAVLAALMELSLAGRAELLPGGLAARLD
ncbi:MAG: DNA-processing protein DprA, partial [Caulobacteraceae bacterium]